MRHLCAYIGLALAVSAVGYAGTLTTFSSRPAFDAAVGSNSVETFGPTNCFPLTGPLSSASTGGCLPAILPGVTYSSPIVPGNAFNIDGGGGFTSPFLDSLLLGRPSAPLTVTFTGAVGAVGFDTNSLMGSTFSIQFNFISGSTTLNPSVPGTMTFFGFQSSATDIQSLVITGTGSGFGFALDNFTFTEASGGTGVPEPASAGLILLGLSLGLAAFRKRR
jgi:hypothetical protein